jgi:hypothetical protein
MVLKLFLSSKIELASKRKVTTLFSCFFLHRFPHVKHMIQEDLRSSFIWDDETISVDATAFKDTKR